MKSLIAKYLNILESVIQSSKNIFKLCQLFAIIQIINTWTKFEQTGRKNKLNCWLLPPQVSTPPPQCHIAEIMNNFLTEFNYCVTVNWLGIIFLPQVYKEQKTLQKLFQLNLKFKWVWVKNMEEIIERERIHTAFHDDFLLLLLIKISSLSKLL